MCGTYRTPLSPPLYVKPPDLRGPKAVVVFYAYREPRTSVLQISYDFAARPSTLGNRSWQARLILDNAS